MNSEAEVLITYAWEYYRAKVVLKKLIRNLGLLFLLFSLAFAVFYQSLNVFFVQDDFLLIEAFSGANLLKDLWNSLGPPQVTHWRPLHNLYFLVTGNVFAKNWSLYHLALIFIHTAAAFFIYKTLELTGRGKISSFVATTFYTVNSSHFVSIFWISGGSGIIGFLFFMISFYLYVSLRKNLAFIFYLLSILSSEAMIAGIGIFLGYDLLKKNKINKSTLAIFLISVFYAFFKFFVTRKTTLGDYKFSFSPADILISLKYYIPKILGVAEVSSDIIPTLIIGVILISIAFLSARVFLLKTNMVIFSFFIIILGFFPFIFLPDHLSPHYMNLSIFGLAFYLGVVLSSRPVFGTIFIVLFSFASIVNVHLIFNNNWVVKRSLTSRSIIETLQNSKLPPGSKIIFSGNESISSQEIFIASGTGKATDFYFKEKNYQLCFVEDKKLLC